MLGYRGKCDIESVWGEQGKCAGAWGEVGQLGVGEVR